VSCHCYSNSRGTKSCVFVTTTEGEPSPVSLLQQQLVNLISCNCYNNSRGTKCRVIVKATVGEPSIVSIQFHFIGVTNTKVICGILHEFYFVELLQLKPRMSFKNIVINVHKL
jgi:hypothetical protein